MPVVTPTLPPAILEEQLCFALHSAARGVTAAYAEVLERYDLTYPQYLVMLVLWEEDGVPVKELCRRLRLTSATVSPLLHRLEAAGRVRRERRGPDARVVTVHLTDAGRALRSVAHEARQCLGARLTLTPDQARVLRDLATRVADCGGAPTTGAS